MYKENNRKAIIWRNGIPITLTNGEYNAEANSIVVSGSDIYAAGYQDINKNSNFNSVAMLWKNGEAIALSDGNQFTIATSVYVLENDVYVIGEEHQGLSEIAILWKNEMVIKRTSKIKNKNGGIVLALSLSNGFNVASPKSVYVTGNAKDVVNTGKKSQKYTVKMWQDGKPTILNKGNNSAMAFSVYTLANDVYVTGAEFTNEMIPVAKLWKNAETITLGKSPYGSSANDVYVFGNDVYVAGKEKNTDGVFVATLWHNETAITLTEGYNHADANSVYVLDNTVYVAGYI